MAGVCFWSLRLVTLVTGRQVTAASIAGKSGDGLAVKGEALLGDRLITMSVSFGWISPNLVLPPTP